MIGGNIQLERRFGIDVINHCVFVSEHLGQAIESALVCSVQPCGLCVHGYLAVGVCQQREDA